MKKARTRYIHARIHAHAHAPAVPLTGDAPDNLLLLLGCLLRVCVCLLLTYRVFDSLSLAHSSPSTILRNTPHSTSTAAPPPPRGRARRVATSCALATVICDLACNTSACVWDQVCKPSKQSQASAAAAATLLTHTHTSHTHLLPYLLHRAIADYNGEYEIEAICSYRLRIIVEGRRLL